MTDHGRARQLAAASIDFELGERERRELADHISTCGACRTFDFALRRDVAALLALAWEPAPTRVRQTVVAAVEANGRPSLVNMPVGKWSPIGIRRRTDAVNLVVLLAVLAALLFGLALSGLLAGGRYLVTKQELTLRQADSADWAHPVRVTSTIPACAGAHDLQAYAGALWFLCGEMIWRADVHARTSRAILAGSAYAVGLAGVWTVGESSIRKLDPTTGAILAQIPYVGATSIAVGNGAIWVADANAGTVAHIDPATHRVMATIAVGADPVDIAFGSGAVWALDERTPVGASNPADSLSRIDPRTDLVAAKLAVDHGASPVLFIAGAVWVANDADGSVWGINPQTNSVTRLRLGAGVGGELVPAAAALDRGWLWVIDSSTGELVVVAPGPAKGTEPSVDPTTAVVADRLVVQGLGPGSADERLRSIAIVDGVMWVAGAEGSLLEIPTGSVP